MGAFHTPPQPGMDTSMMLLGAAIMDYQPKSVVDGGKLYIVADFEEVLSTQVIIGEAGSDFHLHGLLVWPTGPLGLTLGRHLRSLSIGRRFLPGLADILFALRARPPRV